MLGVVGAALFYGDAVITPAISVLSAVEGLKLVAPAFEPYVLPITVVIIVALFCGPEPRHRPRSRRCSARSPLVWFVGHGRARPLHMRRPAWRSSRALQPGRRGRLPRRRTASRRSPVLGSVFLAVTGAEALYADMGHFGRGPIRLAWLGLVFPALALNYLGQGALVLAHPEAVENPFFLMAPDWGAAAAGAPRHLRHRHRQPGGDLRRLLADPAGGAARPAAAARDPAHLGDAGGPDLHAARSTGCCSSPSWSWCWSSASSSALASAYGIAVTGTMVVTSLLAFVVFRRAWRWPLPLALAVLAPLLALELVFLGANLLKVLDGGWVPLLIAGVVGLLMWTWVRGTAHRPGEGAARQRPARRADRDAEQVAPGARARHGGLPDLRPRRRARPRSCTTSSTTTCCTSAT